MNFQCGRDVSYRNSDCISQILHMCPKSLSPQILASRRGRRAALVVQVLPPRSLRTKPRFGRGCACGRIVAHMYRGWDSVAMAMVMVLVSGVWCPYRCAR